MAHIVPLVEPVEPVQVDALQGPEDAEEDQLAQDVQKLIQVCKMFIS